MSLRTLATHLRQQDWTAVTIEILIVIVGVFIGLQVSNWNETRKENARGQEYLQRLRGEPGLTEALRFWMINVHSGLILLRDVQKEARALAGDLC